MGTDTHALDPLAHLCLTAQGWLEAIKDVQALGKPIVAVGGGGYNLTTVPRMWTLAVATLSGATVSNEVPASYAERSRIPTLMDPMSFAPSSHDLERTRKFAAQSIQNVKQLLFPYHGLK
jgi:hypothetical protein